jgi:hypothetical protein
MDGAGGDVAIFAATKSLRSQVSSEVATSIGVVLRGMRAMQFQRILKSTWSVDFDFAETAGSGRALSNHTPWRCFC